MMATDRNSDLRKRAASFLKDMVCQLVQQKQGFSQEITLPFDQLKSRHYHDIIDLAVDLDLSVRIEGVHLLASMCPLLTP